MSPGADDILEFWFGDSVSEDQVIGARMPLWFGSDPDTDLTIRKRFSDDVEKAASGQFDAWSASPRGTLALIILLDQFPRSLGRGTPAAFAQDARALSLCIAGIESAHQEALAYIEQVFFMMPLQHAESLAVQETSVRQFEALLDRIPEKRRQHYQGFVKYAHMHCEIVRRFGRFPHRNAILGRTSTHEEREYLAGDAPRFGQS